MKQTICVIIFIASFLMMAGIIGGVDCGQPMENLGWCILSFISMGISAYVGGFND